MSFAHGFSRIFLLFSKLCKADLIFSPISHLFSNRFRTYDRIFGGKDRYDLSPVAFRPYLSRPDLVDPEAIAPPPEYRKPFVRGNVVGGLYGDRAGYLAGDYVVESDLIIQPNAILTIRAGTKLRFEAGVGILNQGKVTIDGTAEQPVEMDLRQTVDPFIGELSTHILNDRPTD